MPKFIRLTNATDKGDVLINLNTVSSVVEHHKNIHRIVYASIGTHEWEEYEVKETIKVIHELIRKEK